MDFLLSAITSAITYFPLLSAIYFTISKSKLLLNKIQVPLLSELPWLKSILKPHSLNQYFSKDFVECVSCKNKIEDDFFLIKWKTCLAYLCYPVLLLNDPELGHFLVLYLQAVFLLLLLLLLLLLYTKRN